MPQYITVVLNKEKYAIPMENVKEIIKYTDIVKVPGSNDHVIGIINLRNKTIPIINLKRKFKIDSKISEDSKILILTKLGNNLGVIVDDTSEILSVDDNDAESVDNLNFSKIVKKGERLYKVINVENLFEGNIKQYEKKEIEEEELNHGNYIQILKFKLGNEIMAIPVENVQEIVKKPEIYSIPDMPEFVKGVTSLRGEIIQIIDLNALFKKKDVVLKELIIVKINGIKFGLHVEEVRNIVTVEKEDLNELAITSKNSKVVGVLNIDGEIITLLNLEKIFDELGIEIRDKKIVEQEDEKSIDETKLFLLFKLNEEDYAIEIEKVREVTKLENKTTRDVVNIRGEIIPLIDLNEKFNKIKSKSENIIIVKKKEKDTGLIVDEVEEIKRVSINNIEAVPEEILGKSNNKEYLKNIIRINEKLILLIDVDKL